MTDTQLRRLVFKRGVRPVAMWLMLVTIVIVWATATDRSVGAFLDQWPGQVIAVIGGAAVVALFGGWALQRDSWMHHGMLYAAGASAGVGVTLAVEQVSPVSMLIAFCWAGLAAGSWWLEQDGRGRR